MTQEEATKRDWLRLPVVSAGEEYLVMGKMMRRTIRTYKAPERTRLERQITATDRQIDQLVYALYGLTDEEIALVEEKQS